MSEKLPMNSQREPKEKILDAIEIISNTKTINLSGTDAAYLMLCLRNVQSTQSTANAILMQLAGGNPVDGMKVLELIGRNNQAGGLIDKLTLKLSGALSDEDLL